MYVVESIGAVIKQMREEAGLSQTDLSGLSGVPQPTISRIETGNVPGADLLIQIARGLGTTPDVIYRAAGELKQIAEFAEDYQARPAIVQLVYWADQLELNDLQLLVDIAQLMVARRDR